MTNPILHHFPALKQFALNTICDVKQVVQSLEELKVNVFYEPECREDYLSGLEGADERIKEEIDEDFMPDVSIEAVYYAIRGIVAELEKATNKIKACTSAERFMIHHISLNEHLAAKKREKDLAEQNKN